MNILLYLCIFIPSMASCILLILDYMDKRKTVKQFLNNSDIKEPFDLEAFYNLDLSGKQNTDE